MFALQLSKAYHGSRGVDIARLSQVSNEREDFPTIKKQRARSGRAARGTVLRARELSRALLLPPRMKNFTRRVAAEQGD